MLQRFTFNIEFIFGQTTKLNEKRMKKKKLLKYQIQTEYQKDYEKQQDISHIQTSYIHLLESTIKS